MLLLEVDLRHPTFAQQLDVPPGPGLADVLIDSVSMGGAIQSVVLEASPGEGVAGRTLLRLSRADRRSRDCPGRWLGSVEGVLQRCRGYLSYAQISRA